MNIFADIFEEHGAAEPARFASCSRIAGAPTHDASQRPACSRGGVRNRRATRHLNSSHCWKTRRPTSHKLPARRLRPWSCRSTILPRASGRWSGASSPGAAAMHRRAGLRPFRVSVRSPPRRWPRNDHGSDVRIRSGNVSVSRTGSATGCDSMVCVDSGHLPRKYSVATAVRGGRVRS